jgi:hypothetical protein
VHVLYLPHRRNTRKVQTFIALLHEHLRGQGLEAGCNAEFFRLGTKVVRGVAMISGGGSLG